MEKSPPELLAQALNGGYPVVLFAGQSLGVEGANTDPLLHSFLGHLGKENSSLTWRAALESGLTDADLLWLSERFERNVPSQSTLQLFDVTWSAVFTSSIDPTFVRRFRTRGRQPEAVLSRDTYARVPRSRSRPPVYYLLGRSNESVADAKVPKTRADLKRRIASHSNELLNRVMETATARGLVVIAGYDPNSDWLSEDDLFAPLSNQPGTKIIWFCGPSQVHSELVKEMVDEGSLLIWPETLGQTIALLDITGKIDIAGSAAPDEPGVVSLESATFPITPALRLRVEASAEIVDDQWTDDPAVLNEEALKQAFRRFHGDFGGFRGIVEGIAHGFAMTREFEIELWSKVETTLRRLSQTDGVIIVHGQSGTGKSIALGRLILTIRRELKLPVVVASTRIPTYADIDAFCSEAEKAGASASILVCDASQPPSRYRDFVSALRSRGRKLLLVGTSYLLESKDYDGRQFIEAPAQITREEIGQLRAILERFSEVTALVTNESADKQSVLALLYRNLSAGRERIITGVSGEARAAESSVRDRSRVAPRSSRRTALADQLINAGLASEAASIFENNEELATLGSDAAARLIDYVMVTGRLSCPVPLNLVMRVLGQNATVLDLNQVMHLFSDLDLFRWRYADAEGSEFLISPRLQLEAELLCRSRLGERGREVERLVDLIRNVRPTGVDRSIERTFLLDLLQKLDKDGPRGDEYRTGYLTFADTLRELREQRGVIDAALMLRECVFRRQAVWYFDGPAPSEAGSEDQKLEILNTARATVEEAIRLIDSGQLKASKRTRLNLTSERASIYGYLAVQRVKSTEPWWSDYLAAKAASAKAVALSDDYHSIDIALWTSTDVLKTGNLSPEQRAEILADLHAALDLVEPSMLAGGQGIKFQDRRAKVASIIGDQQMSVEALTELEKIAPAAATFLIAKQKSAPIDNSDSPYSQELRDLAGEVADIISDRSKSIEADDPRCQRLLLRLRWAQATGERILQRERARTPADPSHIHDLLSVVRSLNEQVGLVPRNQERFLEAVLTWLSGNAAHAIDIWRVLSRDTEYEDRSRVVRRLLVTDIDGAAVKFRGRVEVKGSDDWRVRVEGIDWPIALNAHEFKDENLARGRELNGFGIAFNYVGPIADPLTRVAKNRQ